MKLSGLEHDLIQIRKTCEDAEHAYSNCISAATGLAMIRRIDRLAEELADLKPDATKWRAWAAKREELRRLLDSLDDGKLTEAEKAANLGTWE